MSDEQLKTAKIKLYEHIIYWPLTLIVLLLALPILIFKFVGFLIKSVGAPYSSARNFAGFVFVILSLSAGILAFEIYAPHDLGKEPRSVMVDANERFPKIATALRNGGIVRNEYLFRIGAILTRMDREILPGRYDFSGNISLYDILQKFKKHDVATILVTIPEGSNVRRIASLLSQNLGIDSATFVTRAFDTTFTRGKYKFDGLEGYLFPETYQFWYGIKIDGIIDMMVLQYEQRTAGLFESLPPELKSAKDVITLASIIEGEAAVDDEMPLISSVYYNRLKDKMLLQADPTVIYALGGSDRSLNYTDLKFDSPYNTYTYPGLPPGPINCPGIAAIKAALKPAESGFLYFVADGTGHHIFSKTLEEHNWARQKIRIMKRASNAS